ncbi:MAG: dihydrolipoyl dehydrogenase [Deltaproteobacteria bacterium RBG_16_47_11]|nr:MAG: dihydrolipoyl dehydrogenase [Deltaproteobacteria bacterium RBG_16_47_11]
MAIIEVVVPMLGITIEKGKILKWHKSEGDFVTKGEPIFEVETDKVVTEVESPGSGILKKILIGENVEVPVLTLVGVITGKNEELPEKYRAAGVGVPLPPTPSVSPETAPLPAPAIPGKQSQEGYDVTLLGAGPGGYVAAIRAAQMGASVLLVEKSELGGTCLNWGCIPTKSFLSDVKTYKKVRESDLFIRGSKISMDLGKMVSRKNRVVETMIRGISLLLESQRVKMVRGTGRFLDSKTIQVSSNGKVETFKTRNVIIATGSQVASLPTVKIDGKRILSSDDVVNLKEIPREVVIIGGGVIGVEFGTLFSGLGSKVTILEMLPQIIATEDEEVIRGLKLLLEKQGIMVLTQAKVLSAIPEKDKVEVGIEREGKKETLSSEKVLMAVGRIPYTEGLQLDKIGVQMEGRFIKVNSRMETNVDGVYAIGDVIGKMMLAHAASAEGIVAVENIMGKPRQMDYRKVPSCVFTFPEVASVGLKESEARQKGYDIQVGRFPYLSSGKALAMGEPEGFVKIIAERELGQILGVHILGEHATDLIGEGLLAMNVEASIEDLGEVIKGHPTLSEAVTEAALDWEKMAIHLPKK